VAAPLSGHRHAMPCRAVDGSCVRLRPEHRNHVWSYDPRHCLSDQWRSNGSMHHRTDDGKAFRTLNILDEHRRECLAVRVKRKLNANGVIDALTDLFILRACLLTFGQTTSYVRNDWVIWHQIIVMLKFSSTDECVSVRHFGQQRVSPITNTEYALAALTVLKTRSSGR